jgi:sRNA-binding protein
MEHTNKSPGTGDAEAQEGSREIVQPLNNQTKRLPQEWKRTATDTLVILRSKYPKTFGEWKPLKIGVRDDITAALPEIDPINVGRALKFYTSHVRYQQSCIEGRERIDLDGLPVGTVTADEAAHCAAKRQKGKPPAPHKKLSLADLRDAAKRKLATMERGR